MKRKTEKTDIEFQIFGHGPFTLYMNTAPIHNGDDNALVTSRLY